MNEWKGIPVKLFLTPKEFEVWLQKEHKKSTSLWLKFAKKGTGVGSITYDEALEVALCYGWIDGLTYRLDETYYIIRFTPRGPKSNWSKRNKEIVDRLIREKNMKPSGFLTVDAAKKDGRWDQNK